jgi:hypothetical protein
LITLTSLSSCKLVREYKNYSYTDSTIVRTHYKDTTIVVPKDSVVYSTVLKQDSTGKINLSRITKKSNQASVTTEVKDNTLIVQANCDSMALLLQQKETEIERIKSEKSETLIPQPYIPTLYKYAMGFSIFIILGFLYKVAKKFYPLLP